MGRKAFICWNILMYKQCFLLKLSLAMMIKESDIFSSTRKSQYVVVFMPETKYIIYRIQFILYIGLCRDKRL